MKFLIVVFFASTALLLLNSCSTTEPPTPPEERKPTLTLTIDDVSCTEAWLQLTTKDLTLPAELTLKKYNPTGDSLSQIFILNTQDSLFYIDSLLPNQTYKFKVAANTTNNPQPTTNEVELSTMDTTSHNFSWQTFTFGGGGSSGLYDVAIIDENNIWAVGEIMIADTSINGYTTYNAVHWDGSQWELKRIPYYFNSQAYYHPIQSVFAFNGSDIWFCGNGVMNWDGTDFRSIGISASVWGPYQMNKIWGSSNQNIYIVGNNGSITRYNGSNWQRTESGTTTDMASIFGYSNFNDSEVICLASNPYTIEETKLFRLNNNFADELPQVGLQWGMSDLWFVSNKKYYVVGNGIHKKKDVNSTIETWQKITNPQPANYYSCAIDGQSYNDIIISGASGEIVHFNGYSWKNYRQEIGLMFGLLEECKINKDIVIAVGYDGVNAIIITGKRN